MAHLTRREETVRIPVRAKAALHESGIRLIASNTSCQLSMEASWPPRAMPRSRAAAAMSSR